MDRDKIIRRYYVNAPRYNYGAIDEYAIGYPTDYEIRRNNEELSGQEQIDANTLQDGCMSTVVAGITQKLSRSLASSLNHAYSNGTRDTIRKLGFLLCSACYGSGFGESVKYKPVLCKPCKGLGAIRKPRAPRKAKPIHILAPLHKTPTLGDRAACKYCDLDIEWNGNAWWDRGANTHCAPEHSKLHEPFKE